MSGATIPYSLRPHKAVDRRIFVDVLSKLDRWRRLSRYAYISMGAYPLEDHKLVYRQLGITRLIAFDSDTSVVDRQKFNVPLDSCVCITKTSGEVVSEIERLLRDNAFNDFEGIAIWLDYTEPGKIGFQVREFQTLLGQLAEGDVVRVTVNAQPSALGAGKNQSGGNIPVAELKASRFEELKSRLHEYLPSSAREDQITKDGLPEIISECFAKAALNALPASGDMLFLPISLIRYSDGQQMLSITGIIISREQEVTIKEKIDFANFPFGSQNWSDIHNLVVPALTVRERIFLERTIFCRETTDVVTSLGFEKMGDTSAYDFVENYKKYFKFYPTLLAAEL